MNELSIFILRSGHLKNNKKKLLMLFQLKSHKKLCGENVNNFQLSHLQEPILYELQRKYIFNSGNHLGQLTK